MIEINEHRVRIFERVAELRVDIFLYCFFRVAPQYPIIGVVTDCRSDVCRFLRDVDYADAHWLAVHEHLRRVHAIQQRQIVTYY